MEKDLLDYLRQALPDMLTLLEQLVRLESLSADKAAVDRLGRFLAQALREAAAEVTFFPQTQTGDHVMGVWNRGAGSPITMLLHHDTVHPLGSFAARFRVEGERMYGPGVLDMKAGHVIALFAVRALQALNALPRREIRFLSTSDEEIGSHTSRQLIMEMARGASLVMVMEPALPDGRLKSSRRAVGDFTVIARGRAAHAGGNHEHGINAIQEMAHHILRIQALTDYARGVATTVSEIRGGTARNVVPDYCEIHVDARATHAEDAERVAQALLGLQPVLPGASLEVRGRFERPAMECNAERLRIFERLKAIAAPIVALQHGPSGAGSDAAFAAALAPTMDGLGAVGDGLHTADEHILIPSLVERAAMNALFLLRW